MKTQKDKIIEILKEGLSPIMKAFKIDEFCEILADRILSETRTLSEEEVLEILSNGKYDVCKFAKNPKHDWHDAYNADKELAKEICSLAIPEQPAMSEDEIGHLAYEYTLYTESWEIKQEAFIAGFKAALSQTKKP